MSSPLGIGLSGFFHDIYYGGANVLYITDSRGTLLVTDRFARGIANKWRPKQWKDWFLSPVNGGSDIGFSFNPSGPPPTNSTRTPLTEPNALPVFYNGNSGLSPFSAWDGTFGGNVADGTSLIQNDFTSSSFGAAPNWTNGLPVTARWIYQPDPIGVNIEIRGLRNGSLQATTAVDTSVGGTLTYAEVSCGSGNGACSCRVFTKNGVAENGKLLMQLGLVFKPTVSVGTGMTILGNAGWTAFDWADAITGPRFSTTTLANFLNACGTYTHLVVDLTQNATAPGATTPAGLAADVLSVIARFKTAHPTITKVLVVSRYDTVTYAAATSLAVSDALAAMCIANGYSFFNQFETSLPLAGLNAAGYLQGDQVHPTGIGSDYFMNNMWLAGMASLGNNQAYNRLKIVTGGSINGL